MKLTIATPPPSTLRSWKNVTLNWKERKHSSVCLHRNQSSLTIRQRSNVVIHPWYRTKCRRPVWKQWSHWQWTNYRITVAAPSRPTIMPNVIAVAAMRPNVDQVKFHCPARKAIWPPNRRPVAISSIPEVRLGRRQIKVWAKVRAAWLVVRGRVRCKKPHQVQCHQTICIVPNRCKAYAKTPRSAAPVAAAHRFQFPRRQRCHRREPLAVRRHRRRNGNH